MPELSPGDLVWVAPDAAVGREQAGRRPALVVAGADYLQQVDALAIVVPLTSVDRGWPNHVPVAGGGLPSRSWAMTEQVRTVSRDRIVGHAGRADAETLLAARAWIRDFLEL
ncbi:type II toxin-antitoxin system PemK/MazF family toxin [Protaetiibacter larvae]|uniref:Type II toxin-antitoxin system PemK/MazF family toxin n=1 Tax=Protaetiibacter larvae TaxID=2592654 RepID=A0A5C1Y7H5_9MICO|nr:type II toxin-antitoxin system PemK/MazF family toxin [Protaetiibacter larvae]QEO09771.1 type II toxin-antitoxin system PemK/MazF family toxin [Protaetiibacter larvae]